MFDAYLRFSAHTLTRVTATHLYTEIDQEALGGLPLDERSTVTGTTEWMVASGRALTFGWDWTYQPATMALVGHWETLRTNLMVIDGEGVDRGIEDTRLGIARLMQQAQWETTVVKELRLHCHH